jgi:hypothetical protein
MTAATAEALAKTLNALVREGWDEPSCDETLEQKRQLAEAFAREAKFLQELAQFAKAAALEDVVQVRESVPPSAS